MRRRAAWAAIFLGVVISSVAIGENASRGCIAIVSHPKVCMPSPVEGVGILQTAEYKKSNSSFIKGNNLLWEQSEHRHGPISIANLKPSQKPPFILLRKAVFTGFTGWILLSIMQARMHPPSKTI